MALESHAHFFTYPGPWHIWSGTLAHLSVHLLFALICPSLDAQERCFIGSADGFSRELERQVGSAVRFGALSV